MIVLYSLLQLVGLTVGAPWWVLRLLTTERYREGLGQRLGRVPAALRTFVAGKRVVWAHAVSVGEVLAATRLVSELEAALGEGWCVVVSTTTRTGQALARERFGADRVFYYPLDFAFAVRTYLRVLKPAALLLMESEVWPRMLHECRRMGTPVVVVNARVSDRSFGRGMRVRAVWGRVLRGVSLWLAQSDEDARRLVAMGAREESVRAIGNLKYDVRAPKRGRVAALIKEVAAGRPIIVAGSTVDDRSGVHGVWEEELVVRAWAGAMRAMGALLIVAPRHPERFAAAEGLVGEFVSVKASSWGSTPEHDSATPADKERPPGAPVTVMIGPPVLYGPVVAERVEVVLLDTIGDLAAVYAVADVAFVGGSLVLRGGHNPLEPAQFGVPVVMGPSYENFRDIVGKMRAANAICIVKDVEELEGVMVGMLNDREAARAMGERGRQVFEAQQGATGRAVDAILALVTA